MEMLQIRYNQAKTFGFEGSKDDYIKLMKDCPPHLKAIFLADVGGTGFNIF